MLPEVFAVTVMLPAVPALCGLGKPETARLTAASSGEMTMPDWLPVIELVTVSVAVSVYWFAVLKVTPLKV